MSTVWQVPPLTSDRVLQQLLIEALACSIRSCKPSFSAWSRRNSQTRRVGFHLPPASFTWRCKDTSCTPTRTPTITAPLLAARSGRHSVSSTINSTVLSRR